MKYLIIDGMLNGTGIRDKYNGGYISPISLSLSQPLVEKLNNWLALYANEKYNGYTNKSALRKLDNEGKEISSLIKEELMDVKISYYSDAEMKEYII